MQFPTTTFLALIATLSATTVLAHPNPNPNNDHLNARSVHTFDLPLKTTDDQIILFHVPADGHRYAVADLTASDAESGAEADKTAEATVIDWNYYDGDYCCNVQFSNGYDMGDILGGGFHIEPAASLAAAKCQKMVQGTCVAWPA
ncbi:hypothetical protein PMZ80_008943 [Knufia obscura]|uniref:Uncharacterized protein n=2 Tax=Knufia TaxID=430999 RepID=A0AAN8I6W0_9EURO|nr:hypothetical protein PMZ80_008943 [Knufia obscura]KAK5955099.1 hypothetical protein OHC33_003778 [Knufia fluminis]